MVLLTARMELMKQVYFVKVSDGYISGINLTSLEIPIVYKPDFIVSIG